MAEFEEDMKHLLLYYFRKGKNAWQAYKKLYKEYGVDAFSEKKCIFWFIRFRSGDLSLEDCGPRIHRSIEADNATIKGLIDSDPHITTRDISEKMDVSLRSIKKKIKKMGYVKILDVWTLRENLNSKEDVN